ncbi:MAG: EAL domain-containing protein [Acutalibacteraceae bacterium]
MWNYNFVIPSFLLLIIFLGYYLAKPRLPIRINRTFLELLILECVIAPVDMIATWSDEHYTQVPVWLLYALNILFFTLFVFRSVWFYRFTVEAVHLSNRRRAFWLWLAVPLILVTQIAVLSSCWTGAVFSITDAGYQAGPLYHILNFYLIAYISLAMIVALVYAGRVSRHEFSSLLGYNMVLLTGVVFRILFPHSLLMDTFCLMAVTILFLSFQNPDLFTSDRGNVFNTRGLRILMREKSHRRMRLLGFVLRNYNDERSIYGGAQMDQGLEMISSYLIRNFRSCHSFYIRNGCFLLVGNANTDFNIIRDIIRDRFQRPWLADGADLYLNVSFIQMDAGSVTSTSDRLISDLTVAFDKAAQSADPDVIINMDSMVVIDHLEDIKRSLENALEHNGVEVFLQPLVDSHTGQIVAAEALSRLRDENGNLIQPDAFIPIAEKSGRIGTLGEQTLQKVCRFIADHDMDSLGLRWINVNLSPIQCLSKDLSERFGAILNKHGVDPSQIHLEVTEQSMVDHTVLEKQINAMRRQGFEFALDDYGSGYSNLARIKHYPFFNIKLDLDVVWDYVRERDEFLPSIVQAFKRMNYHITAEGIENEEMAQALTAIGCDFLQGFHFSKPLPMDEFVRKYTS